MKQIWKILIIVTAMTLLLLGCSDNEADTMQEAKDFGEAFIQKFYDTEDVDVDLDNPEDMITYMNNFQPYLTEEAFVDLNSRREFLIPLEIAQARNSPLTINEIIIERVADLEEGMKLDFTVIIATDDHETADDIEVTGDMTIEQTDEDTFKINRYYHHGLPIEETFVE